MTPETRSPGPTVALIGLLAGLIDGGVVFGWAAVAGEVAAFMLVGFAVCAVAAVAALGVVFRQAPVNMAPLAVAVGLAVPFVVWARFSIELDAFTLVCESVIVFVVVAVVLAIIADLTRIVLTRFGRPRR